VEGGLVTDMLQGRKDFEREFLQEMQKRGAGSPAPFEPVLTDLSSLSPRSVRWLWERRIPVGKLTLVVGDPGLGKSLLTLAIASNVTQGTAWPDGSPAPEPGDVIFISAEDDPADTVVPRFLAAGGDPKRATMLIAVLEFDAQHPDVELRSRPLSLETHLSAVESAITKRGAKLVIVDPLSAYLGKADSHTDAEIRGVLMPLAALAERTGTAILAVMHLNKRAAGPALYRSGGSIAFVAAARAAHVVTTDVDNPASARRLFLPLKQNLSEPAAGLAYVVESTTILDNDGNAIPTARVTWEPGTVSTTASQALAATDQGDADKSSLDEAKEFLQEALNNGPVASKAIQTEARQAGVQERTLWRAKSLLGIKATKEGFSDGWHWQLPPADEQSAEGCQEDTKAAKSAKPIDVGRDGRLGSGWQPSAGSQPANGHSGGDVLSSDEWEEALV
jgi:putative DNA primase/helicase